MKDKIKTALFALVLAAVPLGTLLMPKATSSYYENRMLAVFPPITVQGVFDGSWFSDVEDYISDHLIGRDTLLRLHTQMELALDAPVVGDIVVGEQTLLPYHQTVLAHYDEEKMQTELQILQDLNEYCEQIGTHLLYIGIPEQSSAMRGDYPDYLLQSAYATNDMPLDFFAGLRARGIDCLEMKDVLGADPARYYSRTDHHYNLLGAYETYLQVMDVVDGRLGLDAPVLTDVTFEKITDVPFLGSRNRKLFGLYESDDALYTYQTSDAPAFTREDNGQPVDATVFNDAYRDMYTYYMGGDKAETRICTDRSELPSVLVVGDSFTNALETLLYHSFDEMRSLDFRHYTEQSVYDYLDEYRPEVLLIVRDDLNYISTDGNGGLTR